MDCQLIVFGGPDAQCGKGPRERLAQVASLDGAALMYRTRRLPAVPLLWHQCFPVRASPLVGRFLFCAQPASSAGSRPFLASARRTCVANPTTWRLNLVTRPPCISTSTKESSSPPCVARTTYGVVAVGCPRGGAGRPTQLFPLVTPVISRAASSAGGRPFPSRRSVTGPRGGDLKRRSCISKMPGLLWASQSFTCTLRLPHCPQLHFFAP